MRILPASGGWPPFLRRLAIERGDHEVVEIIERLEY